MDARKDAHEDVHGFLCDVTGSGGGHRIAAGQCCPMLEIAFLDLAGVQRSHRVRAIQVSSVLIMDSCDPLIRRIMGAVTCWLRTWAGLGWLAG